MALLILVTGKGCLIRPKEGEKSSVLEYFKINSVSLYQCINEGPTVDERRVLCQVGVSGCEQRRSAVAQLSHMKEFIRSRRRNSENPMSIGLARSWKTNGKASDIYNDDGTSWTVSSKG